MINKKENYEKLAKKLKKDGFPMNELYQSVYSMNGLIKEYHLGIISSKCLSNPIKTPKSFLPEFKTLHPQGYNSKSLT